MTRRAVGIASIVAVSAVGVCMWVSPIPGHPSGWLPPATVALLIVIAALLAGIVAWKGYRHHQLSSQLRGMAHPASICDIGVQELPGVDGAFVAGLRRPQIFWSPELNARLDANELRAVVLHERYHQLDRAPAKLVLLEAVAPALSLFRGGEDWLARRIARLEIAADRHARRQGVSQGALAGALLKLAPRQPGSVGIGFASATELRLRALLDEPTTSNASFALGWLLAALAAAAVCVLLVVPR